LELEELLYRVIIEVAMVSTLVLLDYLQQAVAAAANGMMVLVLIMEAMVALVEAVVV
jgi:hypothetical protein